MITCSLETSDLAGYYRVKGNFAGATFTSIQPNDPNDVSAADLQRAWRLQAALKAVLAPIDSARSNRWVTAAKISARKRPLLTPVRDNVVGKALGGRALTHASIYWQLVADALRDRTVGEALVHARERPHEAEVAGGKEDSVVTENYPLRIIDVALWMADPARSMDATASRIDKSP